MCIDSGGLVNTIRRSESETLDFASKLRSALVSIYRQGVKILGMLVSFGYEYYIIRSCMPELSTDLICSRDYE